MTDYQAKQSLMLQALKEIWGYEQFRPHQAETILAILKHQDTMTVLPTGGGKSLCYQLPAGLMQGTAVIVSPLISLMADQVQALQVLGLPAAFLNSSLGVEDVKKTKTMLFRGKLKLLYVSPERLMQPHVLDELKQVEISFFAIDEAHCISQWGHDFRPEYQQLYRLREWFPNVGIHAFTATAPPRVQEEILQCLRLQNPEVRIGNYFRGNLQYRSLRRQQHKQQILNLVKQLNQGMSCIIYCLTRRETEKIADYLADQGYKALAYHAGMSNELRKTHQEAFTQEKIQIIVATVAFGMGIDQSNVRAVIHLGLPRSISHYQQESGRAGRDGLPATCVLIYGNQDILFWKRIIEDEGVLVDIKNKQLQDMIGYATLPRCRHKVLVEYFGQAFEKTPCGSCDVCRGDIDSIPEARRIAQMILSAIYKTRQTFGGAYVAQVLTGSKDQKVLRNGHDQLSVYNLLSKHSQHQVHDWIQQLEGQGYLARSRGDFPTIQITKNGFCLLVPEKYEKKLEDMPVFLMQTRKTTANKPKPSSAPTKLSTADMELYEALRRKRASLAAKNSIPAFVVFGDRSLQEMASKKPLDPDSFLEIFGVGQAKLAKFGQPMLRIINQYVQGDEIEI